ncbi:hypothetical protein LOTGIDRAFT_233655 [Lottia gigantea]|uniref:DUF7042 domain-containing protein n=1 Tax=Lottia gigantea TaxID=225164 RepID=V4ABF7_LOTGI|nr:hypothetical protein LOTGIDRAFT_233655 [Lottia gigantea]ESO90641.1 hypothetical protein LOTGIDRAFT_233655 [Lottia gigantea]
MARRHERYYCWILLTFYQATLCLTCTFPTDLFGTFDSTKEGSLDFNSTTYGQFSIATQSQTFTDLDFTCHINSGTKYVSKSQEFSIFSSAFYAYMCLDITSVSRNLYYYYYATQTLPQANDARVKIFPISTVVGSITDVCDEPTPYQQPYSILLKNDTIITEEMIPCPADLQGYFSYSMNDGANGFCENQTTALDTCTNTSILNFDYNSCNDSILYSATGKLYCLFYQQPSTGVYQITLYNGDNTTDNINTHRFSCMMFEKGVNESYATQYPTECQNSTVMNSTTVPSPGASIVFTHTAGPSTLPSLTTESPTAGAATDISGASLTGGLIGGVIFVAVLIVLIVILMKNNKKSKEEPDTERGKEKTKKSKNTSKVEPQAVPQKTKKRVDRNARPIFTPAPPKSIDDHRPSKQPSSIFDMESEEGLAPSLEKEYTLPIYSDYGDCSDLEDGEQKSPQPTFIESKKIQQRLRDSGIVMTPPPDSTTTPDVQRAQSVMARNSRASKMGSLNSSTLGPPPEPVQGPQYNPVKDTAV